LIVIYLLLVCCFAVVDVATRHVPDSLMELEDVFFFFCICAQHQQKTTKSLSCSSLLFERKIRNSGFHRMHHEFGESGGGGDRKSLCNRDNCFFFRERRNNRRRSTDIQM
jgi:hypothetical protein